MMMELLGAQLPSASFVNTGTPLRGELTRLSIERLLQAVDNGVPLSHVVTEQSLVNAVVGLLATGGSTNHTLHLIAIARAAGIDLRWHDMAELSRHVPLLARVYPNGVADVNHMRDAGGIAFIVSELRSGGLLNEDVINIMGDGLDAYACEAQADGDSIAWSAPDAESRNTDVLRPVTEPFSEEGGLRVLSGNLGIGIVKTSAVDSDKQSVTAPCRVFSTQQAVQKAFQEGELDCDVVVVVIGQGPAANGMPELHKLTPPLSVLQQKGFKVALVTDGRMSGASGKVLAGIHVTPEAVRGGLIGRLRDGDVVTVDAHKDLLSVDVDVAELQSREPLPIEGEPLTLGRNLFASARAAVADADAGAGFI